MKVNLTFIILLYLVVKENYTYYCLHCEDDESNPSLKFQWLLVFQQILSWHRALVGSHFLSRSTPEINEIKNFGFNFCFVFYMAEKISCHYFILMVRFITGVVYRTGVNYKLNTTLTRNTGF